MDQWGCLTLNNSIKKKKKKKKKGKHSSLYFKHCDAKAGMEKHFVRKATIELEDECSGEFRSLKNRFGNTHHKKCLIWQIPCINFKLDQEIQIQTNHHYYTLMHFQITSTDHISFTYKKAYLGFTRKNCDISFSVHFKLKWTKVSCLIYTVRFLFKDYQPPSPPPQK